jgi:hypothetical protein
MNIDEETLNKRIEYIIRILPLRFQSNQELWGSDKRIVMKEGYNSKTKIGVRETIKNILINGFKGEL